MARSYTLQAGGAATPAIDFEAELNPSQYAAVSSPPGPALVIAGAGSGKTRTLTYRVAWLLSQGHPAASILLLTFTNKAAREMIERVRALLPGAVDGIWSGTFHSVGNRILRRHAGEIGWREGFSIMDREDAESMIGGILDKEGIKAADKRFPKAGVLMDIFSYSVNTGRTVGSVLAGKYPYFLGYAERIESVQAAYEARKRDANSFDFDDLLSKTLGLLVSSPEIADRYRGKFRHVLVDEYQDTNRIQAELIDLLAGGHRNLMVVGDDAQSIYSWRGADYENILKFPERYPDAVVHKIETNYRSVPGVLEVANAAILPNENQFPKNLAAARKPGACRPALVSLSSNTDQAAFVAQRVMELADEGVDLREIAVLYRAHYHSMEVQLEFTRRGIPFSVTSGLRFFEQAHVKDVAAFLKFAVNPRDETSFLRMVRLLPGIGAKTAAGLWERSAAALGGEAAFDRLFEAKVPAKAGDAWKQLVHTLRELVPGEGVVGPAAMIDSVLFAIYDDYMRGKFPNYEARRDDLETLRTYAGQFESAADFLAQLALLGNLETADAFQGADDTDKVVLSTLHQAKGLEWKVVFLIWLADGMFPGARSLDDPLQLEEERRLFYVGITRCMDELYLTWPEMRFGGGYGETFQRPSRFLESIPEELVEAWDVNTAPRVSDDDPF